MKSEPKAFASLSSGLLARKGAARPAMRPQGFGQATGNLEDLGWNDMGFEPPRPSSNPLREVHEAAEAEQALRVPFAGLTPVESPVHSQQAEIAGRLSAHSDEAEELQDESAQLYELEAAELDEAEAEVEPVAAGQEWKPLEPVTLDTASEPLEPSTLAPLVDLEPVQLAQPVSVPKPVAAPAPRAPKRRSAAGSKGKAAFTLRLDPDRHLKLRLACAIGGRSAQQMVTDALDALLAGMPELESMAEKAKRKGS